MSVSHLIVNVPIVDYIKMSVVVVYRVLRKFEDVIQKYTEYQKR